MLYRTFHEPSEIAFLGFVHFKYDFKKELKSTLNQPRRVHLHFLDDEHLLIAFSGGHCINN